jgi:YkoY family integral membrane protein
MILGQSFSAPDLITLGLLVLLEGALSVDNALVLGALAGRLAATHSGKALRYGLVGAIFFRIAAVFLAAYLLHFNSLKLLGGLYLIVLSLRHFWRSSKSIQPVSSHPRNFWRAVIGMELTDLAFAIDNILAAVALIGPPPPGWPATRPHPKLWIVLLGGIIGLVLTRFAAGICLKLMRRTPGLKTGAYLIVLVVAGKLLIEWKWGDQVDFANMRQAPFWAFWMALAGCLAIGITTGSTKPADQDRRA